MGLVEEAKSVTNCSQLLAQRTFSVGFSVGFSVDFFVGSSVGERSLQQARWRVRSSPSSPISDQVGG